MVVDANHTLAQEEVFGPVAVLLEAEDFDKAIEIDNNTDYGLSASIFTNDLSRSHQFLERSEAGMVRVNLETAGVEYPSAVWWYENVQFSYTGTRAGSFGVLL